MSEKDRIMERHEVINTFTRVIPSARYLEIGLWTAQTFSRVDADFKVGVDPLFRFCRNDVEGPRVQVFEASSDEFFSKHLTIEPYDVIFLDGLHTFDQTLRDFCNAVSVLAPRGVIIIDDVSPSNYIEAIADPALVPRVREGLGKPGSAWQGDVYRLMFFIESFFGFFDFHLVQETRAQLICWRRRLARDLASAYARKVSDVLNVNFEHTIVECSRYRPMALNLIVQGYQNEQRSEGINLF